MCFYAFVWIISNRFGSVPIAKFILFFLAFVILAMVLDYAITFLVAHA